MKPPLSARTSWDTSENPLAKALAEARAAGRSLVDLTESNPTRVGLGGGPELVAELGHPRGALYAPAPTGHPDARAAVARYYAERGLDAPADRIVLSASTSESYAWAFKLLAERGDSVLVPQPSYPLFDFLARLEDVRLTPYPLLRDAGWRVDFDALEQSIEETTRAILVVHPNNPTGTLLRRDDAAALEELAARRGLALIVDEVFGDYTWGEVAPDRLPSFADARAERRALTFVLSGLSKVLALPQLKLGWIVTLGPEDLVAEALRRLEIVADTYLSVSTPVQLALPALLDAREPVQAAILGRVRANLSALDAALAMHGEPHGVRRLPADAGWYAILEVPRTRSEEAWVLELVREDGIVVHPGYFFDMEREGFLVLSLLPEVDVFREAVPRMLSRIR